MVTRIAWKKQQVEQQGKRKPVEAEVGSVAGFPERFCLWHNGGRMILNMWALYDVKTETTHFLCAYGWEGGKVEAEKRIRQVLAKEKKAPKKAPKK